MQEETTEQKLIRLQREIKEEKALLLNAELDEIERIRHQFEVEATEACQVGVNKAKEEGKGMKEQEKACDFMVDETKVKYMQIELEYLKECNE